MSNCRVCNVELVDENWYPCFRGRANKCIQCHREYGQKRDKQKRKIAGKKYILDLKTAAMNTYGNGTCACCGESDLRFLTIDHINGDGKIERDKNLAGMKLYCWMKKHNYPDKDRFRVLCYNCNCARGHLGFCTHQNIFSRDNSFCVFCGEELIERKVHGKNYDLRKNHHVFFKNSGINICLSCSIVGRKKINNVFNHKSWALNRRVKLIEGYGGKCECCGESNYIFLTIDHINGDGQEDRKKDGGSNFFKRLIDNNFPKDNYRLLCYNCNCGRSHTGINGVCPHQCPKQ